MTYRKRSRKQYTPPRRAWVRTADSRVVKLWVRTAESLMRGKGIPKGTPGRKNRYGEPIVKPGPLKGVSMGPATAVVTAGFYLFGFDWPEVYQKIRVPDRRGRPRKLPNNLIRGFEVMKKAVEKEDSSPSPRAL